MLKDAGLKFKKKAADINEIGLKRSFNFKTYHSLALMLAEAKAKKISLTYPKSYIIGADQICVFRNKVINKPGNKTKAIKQLMLLQGKQHDQISAFCLYFNNKLVAKGYDKTSLTMRKLSLCNIKNYIDEDIPLQSCGSYMFEKKGYLLFSEVKGNNETIKGLPLTNLLDILFKNNVISYAKA